MSIEVGSVVEGVVTGITKLGCPSVAQSLQGGRPGRWTTSRMSTTS